MTRKNLYRKMFLALVNQKETEPGEKRIAINNEDLPLVKDLLERRGPTGFERCGVTIEVH